MTIKSRKLILKVIIRLAKRLSSLSSKIGIPNIFQPGLIREIIIADILDHTILPGKRGPDAMSMTPTGKPRYYEYLTCLEGGSGQIDRVFRKGSKRRRSLNRILRNKWIYLAIFDKNDNLKCVKIYRLSPKRVVRHIKRQLIHSRNEISHVTVTEKWAKRRGKIVWKMSRRR